MAVVLVHLTAVVVVGLFQFVLILSDDDCYVHGLHLTEENVVMESVNPQKDEEHSARQSTVSDNTQSAVDRSLLSIKTLEPWHIPEQCMVGASYQQFSQF